jgi:NADH-quinone oxidoreductase subunit G
MDGEPHLAGTAKPDVVRISPAAALDLGVRDGDLLAVRGPASSITLPVAVTPMVDDVVWLPAMVEGMPTGGRLGAAVGARVHSDPVATVEEGVAL